VDERRRHGLRADVHEPPLVEQIVAEVDAPGVHGVEQILRPGHEQPDNRAFFLGHGPENPLGLHAAQQHGLAAGDEAAEPVHLRARMVEGRNAEEHVVARLAVVFLLRDAGGGQRPVRVEDGFREARRAGGEVDGRVIFGFEMDGRGLKWAVGHELRRVLGEGRDIAADEEAHPHAGEIVHNGLEAGDELRPEHENLHVREVEAVADLLARVAEVERHRHAAGLEDAEVDGQPLEAVHEQNAHLRAAFDAAA